MSKRKTPLPDRWDFDKWRNGSPLNPPKGHKVGIYWGDLLTLEYHLRQIAKNLSNTETNTRDNDDLSLSLARDSVDNIEFILGCLRREGKWPTEDHEGWPPQRNVVVEYTPTENTDHDQPKSSGFNDDEIPF